MEPHSPEQSFSGHQPSTHGLSPEIRKLLQKTIKANWITIFIPIVLFILTCIMTMVNIWVFLAFLMMTIFSSLIVASRVYYSRKKFREQFRQTIISNILKEIIPEMSYEPQSYLSPKDFLHSGLLETIPNIYEADNYIKVTLPNSTVELCYVYALKQKVTTYGDNERSVQSFLMHDGWFIKCTFPSNTNAEFIIRQDYSKRHLRFDVDEGPEKIYQTFNRVAIDHRAFENEFQVFSRHESAVTKIINTDTAEAILHFQKYFNRKVEISVLRNFVFIAISSARNFFRPGFILSSNGPLIKDSHREAWSIKNMVDKVVQLNQQIRPN